MTMANPQRGQFEITIGGKTRLLRFTFAELAKLDAKLGRSTISVMQSGDFGANVILQALTVGLAAENAKITSRIVEHWVCEDPAKLPEYADVLVSALAFAINGKPLSRDLQQELEAVDADGAADAPEGEDAQEKKAP